MIIKFMGSMNLLAFFLEFIVSNSFFINILYLCHSHNFKNNSLCGKVMEKSPPEFLPWPHASKVKNISLRG
jgi:hypothetical protein